jgi:hypothetical protein
VLDDNRRRVERIFSSPHSPTVRNWMSTTVARKHPRPSIHGSDYSPSRKEAMGDFKAQLVESVNSLA